MTPMATYIFILLVALSLSLIVAGLGKRLIDYYFRIKWHYISQAAKHVNEEYIKYTNKRRTL